MIGSREGAEAIRVLHTYRPCTRRHRWSNVEEHPKSGCRDAIRSPQRLADKVLNRDIRLEDLRTRVIGDVKGSELHE